jgi:cytochrome c oxidase subunit 3
MEQSVSSSVAKAAKPLLWIGMVSMAMAFAGLTSGYVVARSALVAKGQWVEVPLPQAFWASTALVLLGSFLVHRALRAAQEDRAKQVNSLLAAAVVVGVLFLVSQIVGGRELLGQGYYFTGAKSTQAGSWLYVIAWFHWMHALAGVIVLLYSWRQSLRGAYNSSRFGGLERTALFWHFLDGLWIYLVLFLAFLR